MISAIRELRLKKGLTQRALEKITGIHQPKISYIERGFPPSTEEKEALKKAFGLAEENNGTP